MIRKRKTYNQIILVMGLVIALLIAALIFALSTRGAGAGNTPAELTVYDDPNDALPPVRFNAGMVEYEAEGGAWLPLASLEALFAALPEPTLELTPTTAPAPTETPAASGTPAPSETPQPEEKNRRKQRNQQPNPLQSQRLNRQRSPRPNPR